MPWKTRKPACLTTATLAVAGLLTAGLAVMSGPAQARQGMQIRTFTGKCLDASGSYDRADVIQDRCQGSDSQEFRIQDAGNGQSEIRTFMGRCLDASGSYDRADVIQDRCQGSDSQEFRIG